MLTGYRAKFDLIYQPRETVFHRDIQTSGKELKIRHAVEYFVMTYEMFRLPVKHCLECSIYLLNRNKN